jgi:hypothetical protein
LLQKKESDHSAQLKEARLAGGLLLPRIRLPRSYGVTGERQWTRIREQILPANNANGRDTNREIDFSREFA